MIDESVRGMDLYILVDVCNYSLTYSMSGNTNHMSPDDHYQNLKRIIAAVGGKAKRINVIMPFLYESRQHKRSSRESLDCALALQELTHMGVDNIITFDAHDPRVQNAIPLSGFETVRPTYQFVKGLLDRYDDLIIDSDHMMAISPDEGATERAVYLANVLNLDMGMFYKRRDYTRVVNGRNPIVAHEFLGSSVYRTIDVLMIDDVQFIIGKESTQEEFFHTFNALHSAGKQIILTSDKPPKDMETLEERIRSRFEWGLMADIGAPDYETRMAILRRKVESDDMSLSDDILNYIANNIKSNIRELEGALNKLLAYSNLEKTEITMEIAKKELQNIITPDKPREITPQLIIEVVSEHFQISLDQMISKNRSNEIARPRQIAMYLCKTMTDIPLDSIGSLLGGR